VLLTLLLLASSGATILTDSMTIELDHNGLKTLNREFVVLIETQMGREEFGDIETRYNNKTSTFTIFSAYTKTKEGMIYKPEEKGIADVSAPETHRAPMYANNLLKVVSFPEVEPGSELHYHYQIKWKESSFLPLTGSHTFGWKFPIKREVFTLIVPDTLNLNLSIKPDQLTKKKGYTLYRWERKDIPRIKILPYKLPNYKIATELIYSSIDSWNVLSSKIYDILSRGIQPIKRSKDLNALYSFTKDSIRTISVPLQFIGLKPHPPLEIMKNRYGCPRDKALLLISLLQGIGYDAFPVLIEREPEAFGFSVPIGGFLFNAKGVNKNLPCLSHFGSIIVGLEINNELHFLDPSSEHCGAGYIPAEGESVWVIRKDSSYFYKIPEFKENKIQVDNQLTLMGNGNLKGKSITTLKGCFSKAFQDWVESKKKGKERQDYLKSLLSIISISAKPDTMKMDLWGDSVKIMLKFKAPNYASKQGDYLILDLFRNPVGYFPLSILIQSKERPYPFHFDFSSATLNEYTTLEYPASLQSKYLPEVIDIKGEGYRFKILSSKEKGKIEYRRITQYTRRTLSEKSNIINDIKKFLVKKTLRFLFEGE